MPQELLEERSLEKNGHHARKHRDSDARYEEEVKAMIDDNTQMAKEIISLKKELNRLHYKVKSYQEKNRARHIITSSIVIVLLLLTVYKLYFGS